MRKIYLLLTLFLFSFNLKLAAQYYPPFSVTRMAVDKEKNFTIYSSFQREIRFKDTTITSLGYWDTWPRQFVAKCDSQMNLLWFKYVGPYYVIYQGIHDLQLRADARGSTYMACLLNSTLVLNDTFGIYAEGWPDSVRIALLKFDSVGELDWYKRSSLVQLSDDKIGVGVDSGDNVYMNYNFFPSFTLGADTLRETLTDSGTFVVKFDPAGNEQWLTGLSGYKQNNDFCVSRAGTTHVAGTASSTQGFGPIVFDIPDGPVPSLSVCNASGVPYWQANFTGRKNANRAVGVGPNERAVITGRFFDTVGFNSFPPLSTGDSAFYIASYNEDGTERWVKNSQGIELDAVGVTSANDIFLVGDNVSSVVDIDTSHFATYGAYGSIVRLDSNGNYVCHFNFSNFLVESSCVGPADEFIICGRAALEPWYHGHFWNPVFGDDTMFRASDACIYFVSVAANCELKRLDSLSNWYAPVEKVLDYSAKSKIQVFPNPAGGTLNIKIEAQIPSNGTLAIRDIAGSLMHRQAVKRQSEQIDVSALSPGTYTLEYLNGTEKVVEKFIKR